MQQEKVSTMAVKIRQDVESMILQTRLECYCPLQELCNVIDWVIDITSCRKWWYPCCYLFEPVDSNILTIYQTHIWKSVYCDHIVSISADILSIYRPSILLVYMDYTHYIQGQYIASIFSVYFKYNQNKLTIYWAVILYLAPSDIRGSLRLLSGQLTYFANLPPVNHNICVTLSWAASSIILSELLYCC